MAPKARSSSGGPKAKARGSHSPAPKAKAKAAPAPAEDPRAKLEKEAEEMFLRHEPEEKPDGVIKLAQFADIIRATNTKKCMIFGDDPAKIIKQEWSKSGGFTKRELSMAEFKAWWSEFIEGANKEAADKEAEQAAKAAAAASDAARKYSGDGVWQIDMKDIIEACKQARKKGKTPLLIDNTPGHLVDTYFVYSSAYIVECKKLIVDKATGSSVEQVLDGERDRFFRGKCFKHGQTVMFRLANTACDLNGMFNGPCFPTLSILDRTEVDKYVGEENAEKTKDSPFFKMVEGDRDMELDLTAYGIHPEFNVAVVTQFAEEDYEEFLKDMIPLHLMQPMKPRVD